MLLLRHINRFKGTLMFFLLIYKDPICHNNHMLFLFQRMYEHEHILFLLLTQKNVTFILIIRQSEASCKFFIFLFSSWLLLSAAIKKLIVQYSDWCSLHSRPNPHSCSSPKKSLLVQSHAIPQPKLLQGLWPFQKALCTKLITVVWSVYLYLRDTG